MSYDVGFFDQMLALGTKPWLLKHIARNTASYAKRPQIGGINCVDKNWHLNLVLPARPRE
jgi:hypothetical protein